jgi:hypothetical protein
MSEITSIIIAGSIWMLIWFTYCIWGVPYFKKIDKKGGIPYAWRCFINYILMVHINKFNKLKG